MRVYADRYHKFMKDRKEMFGGFLSGVEVTPVDMYGKRVNLDKMEKGNFEKTAKDIKEFYDLETV